MEYPMWIVSVIWRTHKYGKFSNISSVSFDMEDRGGWNRENLRRFG